VLVEEASTDGQTFFDGFAWTAFGGDAQERRTEILAR